MDVGGRLQGKEKVKGYRRSKKGAIINPHFPLSVLQARFWRYPFFCDLMAFVKPAARSYVPTVVNLASRRTRPKAKMNERRSSRARGLKLNREWASEKERGAFDSAAARSIRAPFK